MRDQLRGDLEDAMDAAHRTVTNATNAARNLDDAADRLESSEATRALATQMFTVADLARDIERAIAKTLDEQRSRK